MKMTWCKSGGDDDGDRMVGELPASPAGSIGKSTLSIIKSCPSCGHRIQQLAASCIQDLPGLPAGVKFDPTDQELLDHLEGKARPESQKHHPLVDEFIPTIEGENGICYTHPEKLPGVNRDGLIRHFFHRPSKAYTTGTRKRRKVHTDVEGGETRWHKTGKTRPVCAGGMLKGYKKILVLYTNYGKQRKPEKTNWVMHQYHLGSDEEEKDGELVVSKVFYQTQPRQCSSSMKDAVAVVQGDRMKGTTLSGDNNNNNNNNTVFKDGRSISGYYGASSLTPLNQAGHSSEPRLLHNFAMHAGGTTSFLSLDQ